LRGFEREDCCGMTVKLNKLDLAGFAVFINVNYRAYVSCFQT
jgi:hypothetical protein